MREKFCADSKLEVNRIYSYETQSGADTTLPVALALCADAASELDVLWHDRDALGVDGTQIGVLEEAYQVGLGCFLQRQ